MGIKAAKQELEQLQFEDSLHHDILTRRSSSNTRCINRLELLSLEYHKHKVIKNGRKK